MMTHGQFFVERMEELVGARPASMGADGLRTPPPSSAASVSPQVRILLDDAYRRMAEAVLTHVLDAEVDRSNAEDKGLRHIHVFIAGALCTSWPPHTHR
jgi:hypothetical protein